MNKKGFKEKHKGWINNQERLAKEFKLSMEDMHNLYGMFYMVNWIDYDTIECNKMSKWFKKFFWRLDNIVLNEDEEKELGVGK